MAEFASWLATRGSSDATAKALQAFATGNAAIWPTGSNNLGDYQRAVVSAPPGPARDDLLTALGQSFERWFQEEREGVWRRVGESIVTNLGLLALFVGGLALASVLVYGMFVNTEFLESMSQADHARGLITFLFAFATIGIMVLMAIALFWLEKDEIDARFSKAKDLLTILVGILGTVIGFYFGTAAGTGSAASTLAVQAITFRPPAPVPGGKVSVSTTVSGGSAPYTYDVSFTDVSGRVDATRLSIKGKTSKTGDISEQVTLAPEVSTAAELAVKVSVKDVKGAQAESPLAKLTIGAAAGPGSSATASPPGDGK